MKKGERATPAPLSPGPRHNTDTHKSLRLHDYAPTVSAQCSYWIGGSWIGAGFTLVCFGLDLKLLWIGSEVSGAPGAPMHMTHPVVARRFEAERVGT
jgi:hypothetical protein